MVNLRLSIHNKIHIDIKSRYKFYITHFKKEYPENFYDDVPIAPADIEFFIDTDFPDVRDGDIYIKRKFKNVHPYTCLIQDVDENKTRVYFKTSHIARFIYPSMAAVFLQAEMLEPLIYLKALEKELLLVHASGVFDKNGGYLFSASKGIGKTTTAFYLLSKGFGFLGDDLVFLSKEGGLYAYPKRIHFFSYLKDKNPFLNIPFRIMLFSRARLVLRKILEFLTGKEFFFTTRLDIRNIMPSVEIATDSIMIKRLFLLRSRDRSFEGPLSEAERYSYIVDSCDTRKSLIDNILKDRERMLESISKKESDIIADISKKFKLEDVYIDDVVRDNDKIVSAIKDNT